MKKAKSRLKTTEKPKTREPKPRKSVSGSNKYLKHLPTLLLSIPFYLGVYYILANIYPESIEHVILPNTFLPLQLVLFLGNFFFFSYLLLNSRRGLEISLVFGLAMFLKLQGIANYLPLVAVILAIFIIIEAILTLLKRK